MLLRQSKRRVSLFCETALGVQVSPGLVVKWQNQASVATRPAYDELVARLPTEVAVNVDETPTSQARANAWIWTAVTKASTVFALRLTKARCVISELLGQAFGGVVTSDRAKTYDIFRRHQWCWAHLKRDFETLAEREHRGARRMGQTLVELTRELFHHWHRVRDVLQFLHQSLTAQFHHRPRPSLLPIGP